MKATIIISTICIIVYLSVMSLSVYLIQIKEASWISALNLVLATIFTMLEIKKIKEL